MFDSFATPLTVACQAPLSLGIPRQEYWSELPFPSPGDLPDPGIKPPSPVLAGRFLTTEPQEKLMYELTIWKERIRVHSIVWGGTCKLEAVEILKVKISSKDRITEKWLDQIKKKSYLLLKKLEHFYLFFPKYLFGCARSSLRHVGSLVLACRLLVAASGI